MTPEAMDHMINGLTPEETHALLGKCIDNATTVLDVIAAIKDNMSPDDIEEIVAQLEDV